MPNTRADNPNRPQPPADVPEPIQTRPGIIPVQPVPFSWRVGTATHTDTGQVYVTLLLNSVNGEFQVFGHPDTMRGLSDALTKEANSVVSGLFLP